VIFQPINFDRSTSIIDQLRAINFDRSTSIDQLRSINFDRSTSTDRLQPIDFDRSVPTDRVTRPTQPARRRGASFSATRNPRQSSTRTAKFSFTATKSRRPVEAGSYSNPHRSTGEPTRLCHYLVEVSVDPWRNARRSHFQTVPRATGKPLCPPMPRQRFLARR